MRKRQGRQDFFMFAFGIVAGAALVYLFDPVTARRRKLVGDQVASAAHNVADLGDTAQKKARYTRDRAQGMAIETRTRVAAPIPDDRTLVERVCAEIGHAVVHAGAIEVGARDGVVTLRGPVLSDEVDDLLRATRSVPGVRQIDSQLEIHETPGRNPALQGDGRRAGVTTSSRY